MPLTSKTGLLPCVKKVIDKGVEETANIEMPNIVVPACFTMRPFMGICNPYPHACSILCNHPMNFEAKKMLKKAKDAWIAEGKSVIDLDEFSVFKRQEGVNQHTGGFYTCEKEEIDVPEALFRKYTNTDSRPITPAPTLASVVTKTTQSLKIRRCITPDPSSFLPTKEKTLLVLDLRRSHSQETFCYHGGQGLDEDDGVSAETNSRDVSPLISTRSQIKRKSKSKLTPSSGKSSSFKSDTSKDSDFKVQVLPARVSSKESLIHEREILDVQGSQISPDSNSADAEYIKRRGKKKRGKKTGKDRTKEGEKEFRGIPDPGETQVSAIESDSKEESLRGSLEAEENLLESHCEENFQIKAIKAEFEINKSFLKTELLKQLQRQLDQEVVDSELDIKRKMALQEALRCKNDLRQNQNSDEIKNLKQEFESTIKNSEKWLSIPRAFTRRSARFELPMDSRLLNKMTPLEYVQNYVFASPERLVLYNHIFNLYKEEPEDDEETERLLLGKNVVKGLGDIMGRALTNEEVDDFRALLEWNDDSFLNFRTFTGIGATCERLMASKFSSKILTQEEDPRYEVEKADFQTLREKLLRVNPDSRLIRMLKFIRDL